MAPRIWQLVFISLGLFAHAGSARAQDVSATPKPIFVKPAKPLKVPAGASAHSKATVPTHPIAHEPTDSAAAPAVVPVTAPGLSWEDALKITREGNADLHGARATIDQYDAIVKQAWGNYLPTVSASASIQKSNTNNTADPDSDSARLNFSENLFNGFGDSARVDQTRKQCEAAQASYDLTQAQVSASLMTAYQSLVVAERQVKLADDIINRRKTNLDIVTLRFESGRENKGSVLLSAANLAQAKLQRLVSGDSVESARVSLAKVLGEDKFPFSTVTSAVPVTVPPLQVDFEGLALQAPELRNAVANEQAAEAGVRVSRAGFFPTLNLSASAGRFGSDFFPATNQGVVSLGLTIPLFDGTKTYYGLKAAQAVANTASFSRQTALRSKVVDIRSAYNSFVEAVEQENVAQSFVTAAETRAEIARSQYNTGLISFQDWDLIESDLVTRQINALTSQNNRVSAEAAWEQSQGQGFFK